MALRNAKGLSSPQQRLIKLDKKTHKYVAKVIDSLNIEQWTALTSGLDDVTKKDFTKICTGMVRNLTETTYKMCRPAATQKTLREMATSKSSHVPNLETPKTNAFIAEIVNEVKQALVSVLSGSAPLTSSPSDGTSAARHSAAKQASNSDTTTPQSWNTLFSHLEEQISTALMVRLEASDFFTRHREVSASEEPDSKVDEVQEVAEGDQEAGGGGGGGGELPEDAAAGPEQGPVEEITTACTNDIICEMYDMHQRSKQDEEARMKAAAALESEVCLVTDHIVDSVMEDLRRLASGRRVPAFRWISKNARLPQVVADTAADPAIFTPQFRLAAQMKVSRILAKSESMAGEAPSGRATSSARDIVGTLVSSLSKIGSDDGDEGTTSRSAQNIYSKLESKVTEFLSGKPESDTEDSSADSARDFDPSLKPQTSLIERETPFQRAMGWLGRLFTETPEPSIEDLLRKEDARPASTADSSDVEPSAAQSNWHEVTQSDSQSAVEVEPQPPLLQSASSCSLEAPTPPRARSPTPARARANNNIFSMMCCISAPARGRRAEGGGAAGRSPAATARGRNMNDILKVVCCINSPEIPVRAQTPRNQGGGRSSQGRDVSDVKVIVDNEGSFSAQ